MSEFTIDSLAQEIRRVDGSHTLGAGALAEALWPFMVRAVATQNLLSHAAQIMSRFLVSEPTGAQIDTAAEIALKSMRALYAAHAKEHSP